MVGSNQYSIYCISLAWNVSMASADYSHTHTHTHIVFRKREKQVENA